MKKVISTFISLLLMHVAFSQVTYYWVGGLGPVSFTASSSWNTQLDGNGSSRTSPSSNDILIFDGTNVGGNSPTTGNVVVNTSGTNAVGQLIFRNGANVQFSRTATGATTFNISGEIGEDLSIDATSTLITGGNVGNYDVYLVLASGATAQVFGKLYLSPLSTTVHTRSYLTAPTTEAVVFESGSECHITDSTATSGFNGSVAGSIIFRAGASLFYYSGRSPIGNNSTTQWTIFEPGSNLIFRGSNVSYIDGTTTYSSSSWVNNKTLANVTIENNAFVNADGPVYKIENFTIAAGSRFTTHTTGNTPVLGNLTVNGILNYPMSGTTNTIVMGGSSVQTISGTGTIDILSFAVANYSTVNLNRSINVNNLVNIVGTINFGTGHQITGPAAFTARANGSAADVTGNATAGSFQLTGVSALAGNTALAIYCNTPGVLQPNTNVIGFGTGIVYLSKAPLTSVTGATFTFKSDSATLITSNPNGFNETTGSVVTTGTRSFQNGINYIINASTNHPFGVSSGGSTALIGNASLNAAVTTNTTARFSGTLSLNSGKLTVRATDTIRLLSTANIAGAPFSAAKYIALEKSGANTGVLRYDGFSTSKLFPVGSTTNYMPVTLLPSEIDSFAVSVFEGITTDGTANGTPMSAAQKAKVVDAVWNVNRIGSTVTSNCSVTLNWPASLEGSTFAGFTNAQVGMANYDGTSWTVVGGTGDNINNTANKSLASFGPLGVGEVGFTLPVYITNINASVKGNDVSIKWQVENEVNVSKYVVEYGYNANSFTALYAIAANNSNTYTVQHNNITANNIFYRIKVINEDNSYSYSSVIRVKIAADNKGEILVYPNPVKGNQLNILLNNLTEGRTNIAIYNNLGMLVSSESFMLTGNQVLRNIKLNYTEKGIYRVVINNNNQSYTQTVLVD
jgi:hypothetical protein